MPEFPIITWPELSNIPMLQLQRKLGKQSSRIICNIHSLLWEAGSSSQEIEDRGLEWGIIVFAMQSTSKMVQA